MSNYHVYMSAVFKRELSMIYNNIYYYTNSKKSADKFQRIVEDYLSTLDLFPEGYSRIFISNKNPKLRKIPINNYIIVYEVDNLLREVNVLHIYDGRQNYISKL